jgi:S-adenosylmethionine:tRNA-ribosyltransferase-isomerase (queuine synthetase)
MRQQQQRVEVGADKTSDLASLPNKTLMIYLPRQLGHLVGGMDFPKSITFLLIASLAGINIFYGTVYRLTPCLDKFFDLQLQSYSACPEGAQCVLVINNSRTIRIQATCRSGRDKSEVEVSRWFGFERFEHILSTPTHRDKKGLGGG